MTRHESTAGVVRFATDLAVWASLTLLLALTLVFAYVPMGPGNLLFGLAVATAKTSLVALYYMHLRNASALLRLTALSGLLFMGALALLTLTDILSR